MNHRSLHAARALVAGLFFPLLAAAQDDPVVGSWRGTLQAGPQRLVVALHVARDGDAYTATFDSITQGANGIPVTTLTFEDGALTAVLPIGAKYLATYQPAEGEQPARLDGTWQQGGAKLPLVLEATTEPVEPPARPQMPKPPFPYRVEEVAFGHDPARGLDASFAAGMAPQDSASRVTLAGTLTVPAGDGPHPAVALITGSGPQDRDESLLGHKPFWVLADHLTRAGIAVLRYDDRGVGASTGDFANATSADFAADAAAALRYLATRDDIDASRLGLIGHSEGGVVAPMVAADEVEGERVAFVVLLAPPGVNILDIILHQSRLIAMAQGASEEDIATDLALNQQILQSVGAHPDAAERDAAVRAVVEASFAAQPEDQRDPAQLEAVLRESRNANTPWMHWLLGHDPAVALRAMHCNVFALFGSKDLQVDPAQNRPPLAAALEDSECDVVRIVTLDGLNHLFQHAETGSPSEYAAIEETFAPEALEQIAAWIRHTTGLGD